MKKLSNRIIDSWHNSDDWLEFAEYLNINSFTRANGERKVLLENGNDYTVSIEMCESDGEKQMEIIDYLESAGIEFV